MSKLNHLRSRAIVHLRHALRAVYAIRLRRYPDLASLLAGFSGSASAAVDTADALALFEAVLHHRPAHILELGPGTSTAVLALAIRRVQAIDATYHPVFVSIEDQPEWLDYHEKFFPAELRPLVELIHRPSTVRRLADRMVACYEGIPEHPYSLIHIDGPGLLPHGVDVSGDLVALAPSMPSQAVAIFDGRQDEVDPIRRTGLRLG